MKKINITITYQENEGHEKVNWNVQTTGEARVNEVLGILDMGKHQIINDLKQGNNSLEQLR